jgi:hypothetical protein
VLESLFWQAAGPLIADGETSAVTLAGMTACAADGTDTPANQMFFGPTGIVDGSSPFPQVSIIAVQARAAAAPVG